MTNAMTTLHRLRSLGLTIYLDGDRIQVGPTAAITQEIAAEIRASRKDLLAELVQEVDDAKKAEALAKLPPVEFDQGPVQMREVVLLKIWDDYLAITREEAELAGMLGGSAPGPASGSPDGRRPATPTRSTSAGIAFSRSRQEPKTQKGLSFKGV